MNLRLSQSAQILLIFPINLLNTDEKKLTNTSVFKGFNIIPFSTNDFFPPKPRYIYIGFMCAYENRHLPQIDHKINQCTVSSFLDIIKFSKIKWFKWEQIS